MPDASIVDPLTERSPWTKFQSRWLQRVMRAAVVIGNVIAWVILTVLYLLLITPYGLAFRIFRRDPLRIRAAPPTWHALPAQYDHLDEARRQ